MTDPAPYPDPDLEAGASAGRDSTPGTPRWVKAFGIVALVLILLVVVALVAGGGPGGHGPSRHAGGDGDHLSGTGPFAGTMPALQQL